MTDGQDELWPDASHGGTGSIDPKRDQLARGVAPEPTGGHAQSAPMPRPEVVTQWVHPVDNRHAPVDNLLFVTNYSETRMARETARPVTRCSPR